MEMRTAVVNSDDGDVDCRALVRIALNKHDLSVTEQFDGCGAPGRSVFDIAIGGD